MLLEFPQSVRRCPGGGDTGQSGHSGDTEPWPDIFLVAELEITHTAGLKHCVSHLVHLVQYISIPRKIRNVTVINPEPRENIDFTL